MKNTINKVKNSFNKFAVRATTVLNNVKAEGYVDSGVKILIAVVIGALLLAGLYSLFNDTIMPTVVERVEDFFDYKG